MRRVDAQRIEVSLVEFLFAGRLFESIDDDRFSVQSATHASHVVEGMTKRTAKASCRFDVVSCIDSCCSSRSIVAECHAAVAVAVAIVAWVRFRNLRDWC